MEVFGFSVELFRVPERRHARVTPRGGFRLRRFVPGKDIDDAVSCEPLPSGNYRAGLSDSLVPSCVCSRLAAARKDLQSDVAQVGVHIADVTHFVHPGTAIDNEAAERCTTASSLFSYISYISQTAPNHAKYSGFFRSTFLPA